MTTPEECSKISVAIHESDIGDCTDNHTLKEVFQRCQSYNIQLASYWMQMIFSGYQTNCSEPVVEFHYYTEEEYGHIAGHVQNNLLDSYPLPHTLNEGRVYNFTYSIVYDIARYYFYAGDRIDSNHSDRTSFFRAPFSLRVWAYTFISVAVAAMLNGVVRRYGRPESHNLLTSSTVKRLLVQLPLVLILAFYLTSLTSLVFRPKKHYPFNSLTHLSQRLRNGELQIVQDSEHSKRWHMLTDPKMADTPELRSLQKAIVDTPDSLINMNSMRNVCQLLQTSVRHVFLGYDALFMTECSRLCFWKYWVREMPDQYLVFLMNKGGRHAQMSVFASYALFNYKDVLIRRMYKAVCKEDSKSPLIDNATLSGAYAGLGIAYAFAIAILLLELLLFAIWKSNLNRVA